MLIEPELRNGGGIERLTLRPERAGPRALRYSQSKPAAHFPRAGSYTLLRPGRARSGGGQNLTSEFGLSQLTDTHCPFFIPPLRAPGFVNHEHLIGQGELLLHEGQKAGRREPLRGLR